MKHRKIGMLGVPLGFGAAKAGSEGGVNAVRHAQFRGQTLADHIRALGCEFTDHGDAQIAVPDEPAPSEDNPKHLASFIASSQKIAESLSRVLDRGEMPVILGGDHAIAIATFSALATHYRERQQELGLIWFDAHADINTPETSPSGNIHGMPLAAILGRGHPALTGIGDWSPKLNARYLAHLGARDIDPGEREIIETLGLRDQFFTMSEIDRRGIAACVEDAIAIASQASGGYAVTFDVDMLDPRFAPGSGTLVRGGATYREAHLALEIIAEHGGMASFEIVEVNPQLDRSNITVELACELILSALGKTIL